MKYGKIIMLFLCCLITVEYGFSQDTADNKKEKSKKQKTEKKAETKTDKKEDNSETESKTEQGNITEQALPAETVANPADSTVKTNTDSTAATISAPAKGTKTKAAKEPSKPAAPERPIAKPQEIKDPIDRKMKGPSGQTVYTSPHGGKYYINNIGVKSFLRGDK